MTRVVIIYGRKLEKILIDSNVEIDVSSIAEKPVQEWFAPQEDRSGWRGLIEEIRAAVADDGAELNFEFQGPKEYKAIFFCSKVVELINELIPSAWTKSIL